MTTKLPFTVTAGPEDDVDSADNEEVAIDEAPEAAGVDATTDDEGSTTDDADETAEEAAELAAEEED